MTGAGAQAQGGAGWQRAAAPAVLALAVALRALAFSPFDISHADELMQYLEQAHRIATGHGILPWETRYGVRNELIPQLLAAPMWIANHLAPRTLAPLYAARVLFAALTLVALPGAWRLGALVSRRHALVAMFVAATWWESVLFSDLVLSESLAGAVLLLAAAPLLDERATARALVFSGFLLGLGVLIRFQFAPFAGVLLLYAIARGPATWRWRLVAGGALSLLIGALSDLARGAVPFAWVVENFGKNIAEGRAARFGTEGPLFYLGEYYHHFGAAPLLLTGLALIAAGRRFSPMIVAAAVTVLLHSLIGHKEYRFVWVATLACLVVAGIGTVNLAEFLLRRRRLDPDKGALAVLSALMLWALLSLSSFQATGGYKTMRGGGALSELASLASRRPEICRLAVVEEYYVYVMPAIMVRPVPISVAPEGVYRGGRPLPPEIARAANALLAGGRPPVGAAGYRRLACRDLPHETACLYARPGNCAADPRYDLQASLVRSGM